VALWSRSHLVRWDAFKKSAALKPHRSRYWLNAQPDDPEAFARQVEAVCACYLAAPQRFEAEGIPTVSVDEMTGIQALERIAPTQAMKPGQVEHREFEDTRHGTQCLLGNFEVTTGQVIAPTVQLTRTEEDFAAHIARTVALDLESGWIFVADNLTTHASESLVRYVAEACAIPTDLGKKGKSGVLKSVATRKAFLTDESHRIRFVYVPKHTSWLNQIEIWFSILVRWVIKRGNFTSTKDLREKLLSFIDYFNRTLAKPFKWTFTGRPLNV
jgi:transposase